MFYAMTDWTTGDNPREHNSGFANTKEPIAFRTKAERAEWLSETKLTTAKAISRKEAASMTKWEPGSYYGECGVIVKPVRIYVKNSQYPASYAIVGRK